MNKNSNSALLTVVTVSLKETKRETVDTTTSPAPTCSCSAHYITVPTNEGGKERGKIKDRLQSNRLKNYVHEKRISDVRMSVTATLSYMTHGHPPSPGWVGESDGPHSRSRIEPTRASQSAG